MIGENVVSFPDDANFGFATQYFFAVEVLGHVGVRLLGIRPGEKGRDSQRGM